MSNDISSSQDEQRKDEVDRRSDFARWFQPSVLPADVRTLARTAATEGAPDEVLRALLRLDSGRWFASIGELWDAVSATPSPGAR